MKFKNVVLGVGILVVFGLVLFNGLETFYPTPEYNDFCAMRVGPIASGLVNCPNDLEIQRKAEQCYQSKGEFVYEYDSNGCITDGFCDDCSIEWNKSMDAHSNRVFIISVIVGLITFVVGLFLLAKEPVGSALMASGIWSVFYGVVKNWRNFSEAWRFLILFVLLIILIWLAMRYNEKKKWGFFKKR